MADTVLHSRLRIQQPLTLLLQALESRTRSRRISVKKFPSSTADQWIGKLEERERRTDLRHLSLPDPKIQPTLLLMTSQSTAQSGHPSAFDLSPEWLQNLSPTSALSTTDSSSMPVKCSPSRTTALPTGLLLGTATILRNETALRPNPVKGRAVAQRVRRGSGTGRVRGTTGLPRSRRIRRRSERIAAQAFQGEFVSDRAFITCLITL